MLSSFAGLNTNGIWTLSVADHRRAGAEPVAAGRTRCLAAAAAEAGSGVVTVVRPTVVTSLMKILGKEWLAILEEIVPGSTADFCTVKRHAVDPSGGRTHID